MKIRPMLRGLLSFIPGFLEIYRKGTGGSCSARYCYSVWLRHLKLLHKNGMKKIPKVVAEIGPGDSLGTGIAALLSGANIYYAFDIINHADNQRNLKVFQDLVDLFRNREPIPDNTEFPELKPYLESYEFPRNILNDVHLKHTLKNSRIKNIRRVLANTSQKNDSQITIQYTVPWIDSDIISKYKKTVDLIYSQAVMEHVIDLEYAYKTMYELLKPKGFISHEIDYRAHETHKIWNGHLRYSKLLWILIMRGRFYPINRELHSKHIKSIQNSGFQIVNELRDIDHSGINRKRLAIEFKHKSDEDLATMNAFIQAKK